MFIGMGILVLGLTLGNLITNILKDLPYLNTECQTVVGTQKCQNDSKNSSDNHFLKSLWAFLENIVLISHAIPMSIYVAIEVLKWL